MAVLHIAVDLMAVLHLAVDMLAVICYVMDLLDVQNNLIDLMFCLYICSSVLRVSGCSDFRNDCVCYFLCYVIYDNTF
jgi:hypothetical protein